MLTLEKGAHRVRVAMPVGWNGSFADHSFSFVAATPRPTTCHPPIEIWSLAGRKRCESKHMFRLSCDRERAEPFVRVFGKMARALITTF